MNNLSSTVNNLEWRRSKVLELSSQGYTQSEIAKKLQVSQPSVNRDLAYLARQAHKNLQKHIHQTVPEEYQKCMVGMKRNLKQTLEIAETTADPKTKLQARAIANDCYKYIMDLTTNGVVVTDAIKFVQCQMDRLNKTEEKALLQDKKEHKGYEDGEGEKREEQETHNGVF
jgi:predicted transcriptional regulator